MKKTKKIDKRIRGKYWRLIVPNLTEYDIKDTKKLTQLKQQVLELLLEKQTKRSLKKWCIAVQKHISGIPHLDILLVYDKGMLNAYNRYDYVIKHGNLTKYRTLNKAILEYNLKQDNAPLTNINIKNIILEDKASTRDGLYEIMELAMLQDPFNFNCNQYLHNNNLDKQAIKTSWQTIIRKIQLKQVVACNNLLRNKHGIKLITRKLIQQTYTKQELQQYDSWKGYQTIINHINQISIYGYNRPHKSSNLLIVGRPNTGKTTLALQIEKYVSVYYKDVSNWFPKYENNVYKMILWNEFSLKGLKYPKLLNLLEGTKMDLEFKGGSVLKTDRQLIYMTSNIELDRHIRSKFYKSEDIKCAIANLNARITQVIIPDNKSLFILLKLIQIKFTFCN